MFTAGVHGLLSNLINHPSTTKKQHFCHQLILATKCDEPRKVWDFARYWAMKMVGWHHWFDAHEFEQAPGVSDGQGALVCCSWWGRKESDTNEWLNWTVTLSQVYGCWRKMLYSWVRDRGLHIHSTANTMSISILWLRYMHRTGCVTWGSLRLGNQDLL